MLKLTDMANTSRYTVEQVLEVLRKNSWCWKYSPAEEFPSVRLSDYDDWPIFSVRHSYLRFFSLMEDMWGFSVAESEWLPFARNRTTMREIAEFISARAPFREIRAMRILGRECLEAAIFIDLAEATQRITGEQIGPGSVLDSVMNKQQATRLVSRMWLHFPKLHLVSGLFCESAWDRFCGRTALTAVVVTLLAVVSVILGRIVPPLNELFLLAASSLTAIALLAIPTLLVLAVVSCIVSRNQSPLRPELHTFRDLVMALRGAEIARFST